jgi:hypothetical protein
MKVDSNADKCHKEAKAESDQPLEAGGSGRTSLRR